MGTNTCSDRTDDSATPVHCGGDNAGSSSGRGFMGMTREKKTIMNTKQKNSKPKVSGIDVCSCRFKGKSERRQPEGIEKGNENNSTRETYGLDSDPG